MLSHMSLVPCPFLTSKEATNTLGLVRLPNTVPESIIWIGLQSRLDAVEGKGRYGRQDAGGARRYLGPVTLYPPSRFVTTSPTSAAGIAAVVELVRRRRRHDGRSAGAAERFTGDILELHVSSSGHRSPSAQTKSSWAGFLPEYGGELQTVASRRGPASSARSRYNGVNSWQEMCHQKQPFFSSKIFKMMSR